MSGQSGGQQRLRLSTLNEHLTCKVCGGYFIDATTIIECLHTFCKSCIVKHLESNKYCPACDAQVHKNKPLLNIRPDHIIQDIVYKLVPGCYQNEMRCRKEFYDKHPEERNKVTSPEAKGEPTETYIYSPDESLSLSLEYYNPEASDETEDDKEAAKLLPRRYLRCPAAVTVFHLQKLIRAKYGLSEAHRVDIMYKEELLCTTYTLMDIMYIYHWRRKVPLHLSYRIFESATKRIKLSDDNDEFKQSLSNSSMEMESKDDEQSIKREWKEVQLKISETGVMSVMDISSLDTKKSTKANDNVNSDQVSPNSCNENTTTTTTMATTTTTTTTTTATVKTEEKEPAKSSTGRGRRAQQDSSAKKNDKLQEEKASAIKTAFQNNAKCEEMEVKPIDQRDLSNELLRSAAESSSSSNSAKTVTKDSAQTPTVDKNQPQTQQQQHQQLSQDKVKTESASVNTNDKRAEGKQQNLMNNNNNLIGGSELKPETNAKQNAKTAATGAGSKINALSAKLQFQPKVGQVNNTYSKKSTMPIPTTTTTTTTTTASEKKRTLSPPEKANEVKVLKTSSSKNSELKSASSSSSPLVSQPSDSKVPTSSSTVNANTTVSTACSPSAGPVSASSVYVTASSGTVASVNSQQPQSKNVSQPTLTPGSESLASMGLHLSGSTIPSSQASLNSWMAERAGSQKALPNKAAMVDQQLRSLPGMPQIGKEIVCSTTAASGPPTSAGRLSIQTPSMSIYYSSPSKHHQQQQAQPPTAKTNYEAAGMYQAAPPCPDAIPISLMKSSSSSLSSVAATVANARKDAISKGTMVNEICDKIRSSSKLGADGTKDGKNKLESQQRGKPEMPELLKISKKSESTSASVGQLKHIPNIPNVPIYTPSNSQHQQMQLGVEAKDSVKRPVAAIAPSSQSSMLTALHHQQQQQQQHHAQQQQQQQQQQKQQLVEASKQAQSGASYKTLRYPPKNWNPTLSKNNYVAAKNQAKELQAAYSAAAADGTIVPRQIPSKPPKIFKNKNTPRFLGNPASGVKPMYGAVNEQSKDKEQLSGSKGVSSAMSMTKIDPQTLSPIVSSHNSMASPPPYSPTARSSSYQNSPYQRNNSSSSINSSPRNSPVNMLSTSPFIPSHTPNTNPRIIYFPPTAGYSSDASHLSNPLIRPPIQPPPSAFHCSLPPSINKLYQRSGYLAQPQTSVAAAFNSAVVAAAAAAAGFSPTSVTGQMPGMQRLQLPSPTSHSSPSIGSPPSSSSSSTSSSSSASSKSPKTSMASSSASMHLATTTAASLVDTVALQLAAKREARNIYDRARTEALKAIQNSEMKQAMSPPASSLTTSTSPKSGNAQQQQKTSSSSSSSSSSNVETTPRKKEPANKSPNSKTESMSAAAGASSSTTPTKEVVAASTVVDKKDKSQTKVNGGINVTAVQNSEKPKEAASEAASKQVENDTASKDKEHAVDRSEEKNSPSKSTTTTTTSGKCAQEFADGGAKQANNSNGSGNTNNAQSKHDNNAAVSGKMGDSSSEKANTEAQSEKVSES